MGKYRDYNNHTLDDFGRATLLYGLPWGITLYGGSQIAGDKYQSVAFGVGQNMQMLGPFRTASGRTPNLTMAAKKSGNPARPLQQGRRQYGHHVFAGRLSLRQRKLQFAERGDQPGRRFL